MNELTIEGRRFAWTELGEGEPLLLVNGYAATSADWDPNFLAVLSASRRRWPRSRGASPP